MALSIQGKEGVFTYIGADECAACHSSRGGMDQYEKWLASPHARAYKTLKEEKSMAIARAGKIEKPWESAECLRCHTTGYGRSDKTREEGVGCEACHGPGSGYYSGEYHVNYQDQKKGYVTAKKYGMYPVLDHEENLIKREKMCRFCHNGKRPCMPTESREIMRQYISIQVIDKLRKGDLDFSHKVRR
jgi:cytochrome c peroxidase